MSFTVRAGNANILAAINIHEVIDDRRRESESPSPEEGLVSGAAGRSRLAFCQNSSTLIDWYPSMAVEHGVSASTAGYHLFLYQAIAVIANLTTAAFISRLKDQRLLGLICSLFITIGVAGILFKPAFSAVWLLFAGVGAGMSMVTCLTLFGLRTREHSQAGQLSGKAQCIGYLIGALGPYLAGIIRGHSLNWDSVLLCILVVTLVQAYFAWHAGKDRFI